MNNGQQQTGAITVSPGGRIAIAATFTAEPVEEALAFWIEEIERPGSIEFAPYNQVYQQLLDPNSLLGRNHQGINVVLLRLEDWQRFHEAQTVRRPLTLSCAERERLDQGCAICDGSIVHTADCRIMSWLAGGVD